MKKLIALAALAAASLMLASCNEYQESADGKIAAQQEVAQTGLEARIGQPRIVNGTEAKILNWLYELRDQPNMQTWTYTRDMNGKLHCIGQSIGYGIPYSAQRSNPQKIASGTNDSYGRVALPQAEPNGLFLPDSSNATFIIIVDPVTGKPMPQYIEDPIDVFTFKQTRSVIDPC